MRTCNELIRDLRSAVPKLSLCGHTTISNDYTEAANMLERQREINDALRAILARTQHELAAAVDDLKRKVMDNCKVCANNADIPECTAECETCDIKCPCESCRNGSNFTWRGPEVQ